MSDRIQRIDIHSEMTSGGPVPVPHFVDAEPITNQSLLLVDSEPVLCEGDSFRCQHRPTVGPFQSSPPGGDGEGRLEQPGQQILRINGRWACTLDGTNTSCSEGVQEMSNRATVMVAGLSRVKVNGAPVLTGR